MNNITKQLNVDGPHLVTRCLSGEIVLVPRFMQSIGILGLVRDAIVSAMREVKPDVAQLIESSGFDRLHELMTVDQLMKLVVLTERNLVGIAGPLYNALISKGLGHRRPVWVLRRPIIRFHVPYDVTLAHRSSVAEFRRKYGQGRLTALRPHRDCWFKEPPTCINIWMALGSVVPGNGLSLFPDDYTSALTYVEERGVTSDQPLTRPVNVSMDDGDTLFFHASQVHASEINNTNRTRVALSLRLAFDDPKLSSAAPQRYRLVHSRFPLSFRLLNRKGLLTRVLRHVPFADAQPAVTLVPRPDETACTDPPAYRPPGKQIISDSDLQVAQPVAISETQFVVRLQNADAQQIWRLDRRCPHEGADLAMGFVDGHELRCPWHNLPIDIRTGRSACASLEPIRTQQCTVRDGKIEPL